MACKLFNLRHQKLRYVDERTFVKKRWLDHTSMFHSSFVGGIEIYFKECKEEEHGDKKYMFNVKERTTWQMLNARAIR